MMTAVQIILMVVDGKHVQLGNAKTVLGFKEMTECIAEIKSEFYPDGSLFTRTDFFLSHNMMPTIGSGLPKVKHDTAQSSMMMMAILQLNIHHDTLHKTGSTSAKVARPLATIKIKLIDQDTMTTANLIQQWYTVLLISNVM